MSSDEDPLAGADIGETRHDEHTVTFSTVSVTPPEWYSDDRAVEMEIADVEVVDSEHPDDPEELVVTYAAELTKELPRNWDDCREPRTEAEARREKNRERLKRWGSRIATAITASLMFGLFFVIMRPIQEQMQQVTVNGEPLGSPDPMGLVVLFLIIGGITWTVKWAVEGGLPPRYGRSY
jgi:hypothetical protein